MDTLKPAPDPDIEIAMYYGAINALHTKHKIGRESDSLQSLSTELVEDIYKFGKCVNVALGEYEEALKAALATAQGKLDYLRLEEVDQYLELADVWAGREDLTVREACHGLAHDAYIKLYEVNTPGTLKVPRIPQPGEHFDPSVFYSTAYDNRFTYEIKARHIRAAHELFGK